MKLFEPAKIGTLTLKNRFLRSATWDGMADDRGNPTDAMLEIYKTLAAGGVGLMTTGVAYIDRNSVVFPRQLGLYDDGQVPAFKAFTDAVHEAGGLIGLQIGHGGSMRFIDTGTPTVGPSPVEQPANNQTPEVLSVEGIQEIVTAFASAASRAQRAGFDSLELNFGHGYLVSQFLAPHFNTRTDAYGGGRESRGKLAFEIVEAVREAVGPDYPVLVKFNCADFQDGGLTEDDAEYYCRELAKRSVDAIELTGGTLAGGDMGPARPNIETKEQEAYFRTRAAAIKPNLGCALVLVGGIRSLETAEEILDDGGADFFSLGRALISEPDLVKRWAAGERTRSRCTSCNQCVGAAMEEARLYCKLFEAA
jgi:2,4-dienoyl-CoA reductase-like NADH-dependent reductase (Old Yellow Enzyme family)